MISSKGLLYVEPSSRTSDEPVVDVLTRQMTAAFRAATPGPAYRGFHLCACGVPSSNRNYTLRNGEQTNSLCMHYLAYHRDELPAEQLARVAALTDGVADPTFEELSPPRHR